MKFISSFILILALSFSVKAQQVNDLNVEKNPSFNHNTKDDFIDSLNILYRGAGLQFKGTSNHIILGASTALLLAYWSHDKKDSAKLGKKPEPSAEKLASNLGIFVNFPFIPMATYAIGRNNNDEKLINFSKEYFAALNLALVEASLISFIPIHTRPSTEDLSLWEKAFRDESSFPSGHTIGWWVMTFKTFQYYGPVPAFPALVAGILASSERVKSERHYITDVAGSVVVSLLASEGTSMANKNKSNHPAYQWIFKHDFNVGFFRHEEINGLIATMTY